MITCGYSSRLTTDDDTSKPNILTAATALYRKQTHVVDALAEFFEVNEGNIKADWKYLDDSVGEDRHLRKDPYA